VTRYKLKGQVIEVPSEVEKKGADSVRHHVLDRACPRGNGDEPLEDADWLLPFDPRDVNADEMRSRLEDEAVEDPEVLGFLRAMEGRTTARAAIEAHIASLQDEEEA